MDDEGYRPDIIEYTRNFVTALFGIKAKMNSPVIISIERISEHSSQEGLLEREDRD